VSIYVNKNNEFQQLEPITRECPHCGAHAQLVPLAIPSFAALTQARSAHVGLVFRCAACNEPRFLRATVRGRDAETVELAANPAEIERSRERFQFGYLPERVERLLRETFECYTVGAYNAFATMCRRTTQAALAGLDPQARRRWQDAATEVLQIGDIDATATHAVDEVLFGSQPEPPEIGADEAAVLIEVVKDLFYQSFVRTAKLRAAIKMRRFFAEQDSSVAVLDRGRRETA
jgi:hypothetical protein